MRSSIFCVLIDAAIWGVTFAVAASLLIVKQMEGMKN
jgi:hypothetical protein